MEKYAIQIKANGINHSHHVESDDDLEILEAVINKISKAAKRAVEKNNKEVTEADSRPNQLTHEPTI